MILDVDGASCFMPNLHIVAQHVRSGCGRQRDEGTVPGVEAPDLDQLGQGIQMADTPKIEQALGKFESALDALEAAMSQAQDANSSSQELNGEVTALREDRARLTEELEEVRTNANRLLEANTQAEARINNAMERIKSVLGE